MSYVRSLTSYPTASPSGYPEAFSQSDKLIREDNPYLGESYVYTYDNAGNRKSKKTYDYTTATSLSSLTYTEETYPYGNASWGDQLTKVGSTTISYDAIGNPLTYNGYELTWSGRQLMEMSMNGVQYTFQYNDEGIRTSKISSSIEHRYTLNGSQIVSEAWVTKNTDGDENVVHFLVYLYDESGAPIGLQYRNEDYQKYTFDTYYFEKNLQGDIIAIYTEAGVKIGSYTYDAWGNCTPLPEPDATTFQKRVVRTLNPFRYRGYYYDTETSLYYLQSRYYNPATGRFINADGYVSTGTGLLGYNMYTYCDNNPVMYIDQMGDSRLPFYLLLYPGFIHSAVQAHICARYNFNMEVNIKRCRIDLVEKTDNNNYVYEVKPATYKAEYRLLSAVAQLDHYIVISDEPYTPGDTSGIKGHFICTDGASTFSVFYWGAGDGIILYAFFPMKLEPDARDVTVKKKQNESGFDVTLSRPAFAQDANYGIQWQAAVLAIGLFACELSHYRGGGRAVRMLYA